MLNSTFDLINLAALNSHAVFFLCNLIIVILLVGSSKSRPESNEDKPVNSCDLAVNNRGYGVSIERTINTSRSSRTTEKLVDDVREGESLSLKISIVENDRGTEEEDDDEDELRKRVEEFIEKINRKWKDE